MTAEQFRAALEALGWTHEDAARILRVANRQRVGEWARGARAVPPYIAAHVETLTTARGADDDHTDR